MLVLALASDPIAHRRLAHSVELQGIPCAAGDAWFFPDGKLANCSLARDFVIGHLPIPKGSWLSLTRAGVPDHIFLAKNTNLDGYLCKGGGLLGPSEGPSTAVYPSGALKTCWLAEDTTIEGVPCSHASMIADVMGGNSGTYFRGDGRLEACMLSRNVEFQGKRYRKGERIQLPQR